MLAVVIRSKPRTCDSYCKEKESDRDVKCDKATVLFFEWCLWYVVSMRQNLTKGALNDWALIICMFVSYGGTGTSKLSIAVNCVQSSTSSGVICTVAEVVIQTARTHGWVLASNGGVKWPRDHGEDVKVTWHEYTCACCNNVWTCVLVSKSDNKSNQYAVTAYLFSM